MKLSVVVAPVPLVHVRNMPEGVGVVVGGQFDGEIVLRNVAGWSTLDGSNRYWPSAYASRKEYEYTPDFSVRMLTAGDTIHVSE